MPAGEYNKAFELVMDEIRSGNTYLLNLTFPTRIETDLSLEEIYERANTPYKVWFHKRFVVFSPESFVRINDGIIASFPMKGTIAASVPDAERKIMDDPKETAEHATIVDLIRNDLSIVAENVRVSRYRFIDRIQTNFKDLLQVSSEITGELNTDYKKQIGDIMFSLLPAGSVTGAPKKKTLEIIRKAENYQRGFYTGICGFFDGQNLDSGVMIRFIEQAGDGILYYKSGGGITAFSHAGKEYNELIDKVYVPFI
jgi:para-aminobenzoate synthetase component 1